MVISLMPEITAARGEHRYPWTRLPTVLMHTARRVVVDVEPSFPAVFAAEQDVAGIVDVH